MSQMDPEVAAKELSRRMVRHMVISTVGILVLIFGSAALGVGLKQAFSPGERAHGALAFGIGACIVAGVGGGIALGWWSAWKYLRCPACDGWIAFYLSAKMSLFSSAYSDECPRCGVTLFGPRSARRRLWIVAAAVLIGALLAVITRLARH